MQKVHNLRTFLQSMAANPQAASAVKQGTLYEYTVKHVLERLHHGISLTRCGKAGDFGVDLVGDWQIDNSTSIALLVQCKSSQSKVSGRIFREMEGVHSYHVRNTKEFGRALMVVAAPSTMTSQGMSQFDCTDIPMICCRVDRINPIWSRKIQDYDERVFDDALRGVVPNFAAQQAFPMLPL